MSEPDDILRASEIGQYAYCARSWWLARVKGLRPSNLAEMAAGTAAHRRHGRTVQSYHLWRRVAFALFCLAAALLVAWAILSLV